MDLYSNTVADASGHGEGETYLGSTTVTTDGSGNADFTAILLVPVPVGQLIAATATAPDGSDDDDPSMILGGGKIIIHSKGNALQAAGGAAHDGAALSTLSYATLQPVVNQAIRDWAAEGADATQLDLLSGLDVQIADLSESYLGISSASTNIVWIDANAAGYGWGAPGSSNLLAERPAVV